MKFIKSELHLGGADGLRAIACLAVIFHHFAQRLSMDAQALAIKDIQAVLLIGNAGVSIFFVLSGFLLSFPFWRNFLEGSPFPALRHYMYRRAARIVPAYYLVFFISIILVLVLNIKSDYLLLRSIAGLTFTSAFHYITFFPSEINGPFWSISFEVFCYALMPLFMIVMFKLIKRRGFNAGFMYWIVVLFIIMLMNHFIHQFLTPGPEFRGWQYGNIGGAKLWMPSYNVISLFAHFAIGILASGVAAKLRYSPEKVKRLMKRGFFDVLGGVSLALAIIFLWNVRFAAEFSVSWQQQPFFFPYFTILVAIVLAIGSHTLILKRILDNKLFRYTAKISFGLYLWHYLLISLVAMWAKDYHYMGVSSLTRWALMSASILAVSYIIATLSYYFVEKPVLDWAHKIRFKNKVSVEKLETREF